MELAEKLAGSSVKVGKFRADGEQKAFAQQELQLGSFPTILFFPKHSSRPVKYPSKKRDVDSLVTFVNALGQDIEGSDSISIRRKGGTIFAKGSYSITE